MPQGQEYGILIYDVPVECKTLYNKILRKIRRRAIRMNLSVYLIPWGMRDSMQSLMDEAMEETGQSMTVNIIKFDSSSEEQIELLAKESLRKAVRDAIERLSEKIRSVEEEAAEVSREYFEKTKSYLQDSEVLAGMFGFEQDLQGVLGAARRVYEREWEARTERMRARAAEREARQQQAS